jgi:hypothetical protein
MAEMRDVLLYLLTHSNSTRTGRADGGQMANNDLGTRFRGGEVRAHDLQPPHITTVWVIATVLVSLLPYLLLMLIYHSLAEQGWPSPYFLFGRGDLGTVVIGITAATITEIIVGKSVLGLGSKAVLGLTSVMSGFVAISLFTLAQYQALSHQDPDYSVNTITLALLLLLVVVVHLLLIVRRRSRGGYGL